MALSTVENQTLLDFKKGLQNGSATKNFVLVQNPAELEIVLSGRLPVSANVSNNGNRTTLLQLSVLAL